MEEFQHDFDEHDDAFWNRVGENCSSGKIRLVFLADEIPGAVQAIVEFMNERMTPTEVLAVEVRQYRSDEKQLLHAALLGSTDKARAVKGQSKNPPALDALLSAGALKNGDDLWVLRLELPTVIRPQEDNDPRLRFTLAASDGKPSLRYSPHNGGMVTNVNPTMAFATVRKELDASFDRPRPYGVAQYLSPEPGGQSLAEMCKEKEIWRTD